MRSRIYIFYLLFFVLIVVFNNCGIIYFSDSINYTHDPYDVRKQTFKNVENRKLNWNDFPGKVYYNTRVGAEILYDLCYTYDSVYTYAMPGEISETLVNANIKVFAGIGSLSWVDSLYRNSIVLNHEQRHYDIAKFYAAKFRKIVPSLKPFPRFNWVNKLDSVKKIILEESYKYQIRYDEATSHGSIRAYQEKWDKRIDSLLSSIK